MNLHSLPALGQAETGSPEKIDDLIYISLYREGQDAEEEITYTDHHVIGEDDIIWASADSFDLGYDGELSSMRIRIIQPLSGEVVLEAENDPLFPGWVNIQIHGNDLSSSRYVVKVEGLDANGTVLFYGERDIYVESRDDVPVVGAVVGAVVGIAGGVGAGIAMSSMSAGFSAGSSTAASSGSSFTWKNLLFGLATEYGEEQLRERTGKGKKRSKKENGKLITKREFMTMLVAVIFMVIAFGYVEMMGILSPHDGISIGKVGIFAFPEFGIVPFLIVLPIVVFTSVTIILALELIEEFSAKYIGLSSELRLWPVGLITLLVSAFLLMPFGYPAKSTLKGKGEVPKEKEALIASIVMFSVMGMMLFFGTLYLLGFLLRGSLFMDIMLSMGTVGLSICSMILLAGTIPFRPMEGQKLWKYSRTGSLTMVLVAAFIFWIWNFRFFIIPPFYTGWIVNIPGWMGAVVLTFFGAMAGMMIIFLLGVGGRMSNMTWVSRVKLPHIYLFDEEE